MTAAEMPWGAPLPAGAATGVGSLAGTDATTAQRLVFDLLPDLPHLVELPERGPGADLVGRGAALLTDLAVDLQPAGWRFVPRPGRDLSRARDTLARDLEVLAEVADGWTGPLKLQAAGPWTLAATVELQRGDKSLADPSAVADIAASLAVGLAEHVTAVRRAVPGASVVVQLDEPALPAVAAGRVPTASGFSALRVPETSELQAILAAVLTDVPAPGVHCCASDVPIGLLRSAGARWVSLDITLLGRSGEDAVGEAMEAGTGLVLGLEQTVVSPRCGMAADGAYRAAVEAGRRLAETVGR